MCEFELLGDCFRCLMVDFNLSIKVKDHRFEWYTATYA